MGQAASVIVSKMLSADLISENETELYNYGVQVLLEKIISYVILFGLALFLHSLTEIALFFVSFSIIRKYSGGVHCRRVGSCLLISTIVSFSGIVFFPLAERMLLTYQGGVIMSIIIVIIIGAVNNPNIEWSGCEYRRVRRLSRMIVLFEASVLLLLLELHTPIRIRFYISYGIVICAISMLLEIRKKGGIAHEEC